MDLDLDSLLRSNDGGSSTNSDNEESNGVRRRTVDEILNDSDSESDSPPCSPLPRRPAESFSKNQNESPKTEEAEEEVKERVPSRTVSETLESLLEDKKIGSFSRRSSGEFSGRPILYGRSQSRPLPSLFGVVRPNPKPGAALAAAAAASRSVPTPHAAAIKFRRANRGALDRGSAREPSDSDTDVGKSGVPSDDGLSIGEGSGATRLDVKSLGSDDREGENLRSSSSEFISAGVPVSEGFIVENGISDTLEKHKPSVGELETEQLENQEEEVEVEMNLIPSHAEGESLIEDETSKGEEDFTSILSPSVNEILNEENNTAKEDGVLNLNREEIELGSDFNEIIEDKLSELETKRAKKKAENKSLSSKKPLELAEEMEKRLASSGLDWEEGAAAQPMRLKGIRRGPPAVGYVQIDPDNVISRTANSQTFRREHGSFQVVAVHLNYIAVGTSRGAVLLMPSKYSPHSHDNMEGKISVLGSHGEKSQSSVTSMCFNQQGDLLLVGYGDGHLTVWDVQRAVAAKLITGEHTSPVVHAFFIQQDSHFTRQYKAVTGDSKGLVLLHTFSVVPFLLNRFSIKTQCLLDGPKTGIVLSASPLLYSISVGSTTVQGSNLGSTSALGSMVGGVVGGVVGGGDTGWKLFSEGSSFVEESVAVFVTHLAALVVRLSPSIVSYGRLSKPEGVREGSMPYTAWKCTSYLQSSTIDHTAVDALDKASFLVIAWDRRIQVVKLVKTELKLYREWSIDSEAIGVAWLGDQILIVLTMKRQLCLFTEDGTEIYRTSFVQDGSGGDDMMTYHTQFTNTYGNPEKAYHNSVAVRGATIYIVGPMHLVVSRLLPWKERIQVLQKAGDWMGALDMAMKLYDGQAHGVIDLPRTIDFIQEAIMPYLVELILSYVDEVFSYISIAFFNQTERVGSTNDPNLESCSVHSEIEEQFARVGGVAVEFCIHIKRTDILFDDIFSKFVSIQHGGTFLEILEPYILKDMLGCLPPEIMQGLVEHYSGKGWLQRVEQCVLHMDISSLDFNQVVRLCREHGLYGALIYLFNRGLDDFKAPLEELLVVVQNKRKEDSAVGYRMLVYLKYCFSGLAFPPGHGTLSSSRLPSLTRELLQFLLEDSDASLSQFGISDQSSTGVFPNFYYLLFLDTEATLEVLGVAFSEQQFSSLHDLAETTGEAKETDSVDPEDQNTMLQLTVNALIQFLDIVCDSPRSSCPRIDAHEDLEDWHFKKGASSVLEFISHFVACKRATVSEKVLKHILEYLTFSRDFLGGGSNLRNETSRKREKQVLALLNAVPETDWNSSDVLHFCVDAQFYQACGLIYMIKGDPVSALDSYMKDLDEPVHAFAFIHHMLFQLRDTESSSFRSAVISRLPELVNLSREGTFFLVIDHFDKESSKLISELRSNPRSLFLYLKTVIEVHMSGSLNISTLEKGFASEISSRNAMKNSNSSELVSYMERITNFPKPLQQNSINVTDELAELYLELLCQYELQSVHKFLETFENYKLEPCLRLCLEYGATDAAAFLLERVGDVGGALELMMSGLHKKLDSVVDAVENRVSELSSSSDTEMDQIDSILKTNEVVSLWDLLHASIGLCQRNTSRLDSGEADSLWFRLLDLFCAPLRYLYDRNEISVGTNDIGIRPSTYDTEADKESLLRRMQKLDKGANVLRRVFSKFTGEIIGGMVGYVPLPTIMAKLLSDNGSQEFGDFKLTIMGMLGTYGYERRILGTAKSLIEDDTFYTMSLLKKGASHAYAPQSFICCLCSCSLTKSSSNIGIRVFNCGHAAHLHCELQENEILSSESLAGCPICIPQKKTVRGKAVLVENGLVKDSLSRPHSVHGVTTMQYHLHDSDAAEKSYGLHQMSRFEILSNLQKSQQIQVETLPQLRLSPPAVYHEKVKKGPNLLTGDGSTAPSKSEKPSKKRLLREKLKGSSIPFSLKSNMFGSEKNKT
ncbi:hypothetical protein QJS04_geneDACA010854 [Acorus gramineus]|uniref:RING-type domain-containing protein n=1 Tax=Acorus gramineus TaxID=55184 RepID=A0AAV9BA26_ACOGR|nr:hypothetical protein QJS04_geneDACA010854 [Acorus gramineus]